MMQTSDIHTNGIGSRLLMMTFACRGVFGSRSLAERKVDSLLAKKPIAMVQLVGWPCEFDPFLPSFRGGRLYFNDSFH